VRDTRRYNDWLRRYNEWLEFHAANPQIYELYCKYVDKVIARGDKKCCSTAIWGAMNFDLAIKAGTKRMPQKYCAYYAHYWTEQHPEHPHFFKKQSKAIGPLTS
jgi:hypothetical protein